GQGGSFSVRAQNMCAKRREINGGDDSEAPKKGKRGGGRPGHTPGKGHRRKSDPRAKKRFRRKAATKRAVAEQAYQEAIQRWQSMSEAARQMRPELHPDNFKP